MMFSYDYEVAVRKLLEAVFEEAGIKEPAERALELTALLDSWIECQITLTTIITSKLLGEP